MYKEAEMRRIHESSGISAQFLTMTIDSSAPFLTGKQFRRLQLRRAVVRQTQRT